MKTAFFYFPYLFVLLTQFLPTKPWFFPAEKTSYIIISLLFILLQFTILYLKSTNSSIIKHWETYTPSNWIIAFLFFVSLIIFPIRNMNWGDGLLLLETNLLETKLFGFQFTLDEILETVFHSQVSNVFFKLGFSDDPRISYTFLSQVAGIGMIFGFLWMAKENSKTNSLSILVLLSSGGILLTFGYAENYTLVTSFHLLLYIFVSRYTKNRKDDELLLYGATSLVAISMLFHLVSGYLVLLLIYLWYEYSPKEKKIKHLFLCALIGFSILIPWFIYFLFFHDPIIDRNSTHLIHPPFYPKNRLVSLNHIKEILSVLYWNASIASLFLLHQIFFSQSEWKNFINRPESKVILVSIFAFFLHGFFHNPQLGFPADWDLMGFYWLPIVFLAHQFWIQSNENKIEWVPAFLFGTTIVIISAITLNKNDPDKEVLWDVTKVTIQSYVLENKKYIDSLPKEDKKFFAKGDFLFYKGVMVTTKLCDFPTKNEIIRKMESHRKDWKHGFESGGFKSKEKLGHFLTEATKTNIEYIKSLEVNKICHPTI
ncbi:dolichyl-phosphate-mannose--protein mannosyltransferase [Leptospira sp. 2 VSF19]|uniref:Dolichyl-phosphate-mannose--protein mannosyltransferase n=1 Tax=Leptospira soteropolitanensis TaxID=2950025 RepID=A0AAW5VGU4_9LEPT|nr:dolichyl-phosphate-mannose--protein mannosyltransferase [Leptospira soteropolitanensis]MCW7494255.1 dolichyl-phosphate-mannose--protein mannosyltransferase [Leptospira soteropolitanensis]MCW7501770.1 dolichyl-phosphate-mannose--protein mannosyltransferase [Leptospira soteropolitanensis]MCW7524101.1 dolichyl-phosphate-mannose--protein mannosyltransferase [Leptospira soteropolitanensis]MCW7527966.1 dolichyl-phosphate-mannose--protein mannosyltransferase [Leptospira soteropolitanensis]MCW75317